MSAVVDSRARSLAPSLSSLSLSKSSSWAAGGGRPERCGERVTRHAVAQRPAAGDKRADEELISFSRDLRDAAAAGESEVHDVGMKAELQLSARELIDLWQQDARGWLTYDMCDNGRGETRRPAAAEGCTGPVNLEAEGGEFVLGPGEDGLMYWRAKALELQEKCDKMYELNQRILKVRSRVKTNMKNKRIWLLIFTQLRNNSAARARRSNRARSCARAVGSGRAGVPYSS